MFSLTIVFGPGPMVWTLMYKEREKAENHRAQLAGSNSVILVDDFGQEATFFGDPVNGVMLEDLEQSKLAHIERALHQARTKIKADEMAMADPAMRAAAQRHQSPILQPAIPGMAMAPNGQYRG